MDCSRSSELMSLALDHQLSSEEKSEFETHLATCDACNAEYELYRSIQVDLTSLGEDEAALPEGFHESLMSRIDAIAKEDDKKNKPIPLYKKIPRRYMNVAAVLVLAVVLTLIGVNNLEQIRTANDMTGSNSGMSMSSSQPSENNEAAAVGEMGIMMEAPDATEEVTDDNVMDGGWVENESTVETASTEEKTASDETTEKKLDVQFDESVEMATEESDDTKIDREYDAGSAPNGTSADTMDDTSEEPLEHQEDTAFTEEGDLDDLTLSVESKEGSGAKREITIDNKVTKGIDRQSSELKKEGEVLYSSGLLWPIIIGVFILVTGIGGALIIKKTK